VLDEEHYVDGYQVGPTLEYVRKWPPDRWPLAFFGMLHIIPQRDFNFIEEELKRAGGSPHQPEPTEPDADESEVAEPQVVEPSPVLSGATTKKRSAVASKSRKSSHRRRSQKRR